MFALFVKSDLLLVALFKRAKERFATCCSFGKEQKSESLLVALLERGKEQRAKERLSNPGLSTVSDTIGDKIHKYVVEFAELANPWLLFLKKQIWIK